MKNIKKNTVQFSLAPPFNPKNPRNEVRSTRSTGIPSRISAFTHRAENLNW